MTSNLTNEEKEVLISQAEKSISDNKKLLIIGIVLIIVIIGIFMVPVVLISIKQQKKKIDSIRQDKIQIESMRGVLSRKNVGLKAGVVYAYYIDNVLVPGKVRLEKDDSGIQDHLGETIEIEFIPEISEFRSYTDSSNRTYNFITKR